MKTETKSVKLTLNEIRTAYGAIRFTRLAKKSLGSLDTKTLEKISAKLKRILEES